MGQVEDPGTDLGRRPVGATSVSRTTAVATGAETARWRTTSGTPRIATGVVERSRRVGRAERLVGSEVAGQAVGRAAGAPRQGGPRPDRRPVRDSRRRRPRPASAPLGRRAARRAARPAARTATRCSRDRRMRVRRRRPPAPGSDAGTAPARRTRARTRRPPARRRRRSGSPFSQRSKKRDQLVQLVEVRAGRRRCGQPWTQLPTIVRRRGGARGLHPERRVDVRIHPAADVEDRRLDRVVVRARATPAASTGRRAAGGATR